MPKSFIVAPLAPEDVDFAFPVAQALRPSMTAAEWRAMAGHFLVPPSGDRAPGRRGIFACRMGSGHIRGLFCYALDAGRALHVQCFVAVGLFDALITAAALIDAIDQLARKLGAVTVEVDTGSCVASCTKTDRDATAVFLESGYLRSGDVLVRLVEMEAAAPRYPVPVGHA